MYYHSDQSESGSKGNKGSIAHTTEFRTGASPPNAVYWYTQRFKGSYPYARNAVDRAGRIVLWEPRWYGKPSLL